MSIQNMASVKAHPANYRFPLDGSAVVVVDMQNDFASDNGMFALAGIDTSGIRAAVTPTLGVLSSARAAGLPVVYLQMAFREDLSDVVPDEVHPWAKRLNVGMPTTAPDGSPSRVLVRDTWNTDIVPDLAPQPEDTLIYKNRFSGFVNTALDETLGRWGVTHLIFTGCTTSVCVESTVRDAVARDLRCLLLRDCTAEPVGNDLARSNHEASLLVLETLFCSVSDSKALVAALDDAATNATPSGPPGQGPKGSSLPREHLPTST